MQQTPSKHGPGRPARPADTIRPLVVPQVDPPYDDEPTGDLADGFHDGNGGCLPAAAAPPASSQGEELQPRQPASPQSPEDLANQHNPGSHAGGEGAWAGQFAQVLAETLAGSRPHRQLTRWTTEQVHRQIRQLLPMFATGERPLVRRVMTATPASGVLELTAVVRFGSRVRVLAVRLERERSGHAWCCTAIETA